MHAPKDEPGFHPPGSPYTVDDITQLIIDGDEHVTDLWEQIAQKRVGDYLEFSLAVIDVKEIGIDIYNDRHISDHATYAESLLREVAALLNEEESLND